MIYFVNLSHEGCRLPEETDSLHAPQIVPKTVSFNWCRTTVEWHAKGQKWRNHWTLCLRRQGIWTAGEAGLAVRTHSQVNQKSHAESKRYLWENSLGAVWSQSEMEPSPNPREQAVGILLCSARPGLVYKKQESCIQGEIRSSSCHQYIQIC